MSDSALLSYEITIPVLNEEASLATKVGEVLNFLDTHHGLQGIRIAIADNGSSDNTRTIAEHLVSQHSRVRYLRLEKRGVGLALKASWETSGADIVGYFDLDLATDLRHLSEVAAAFDGGADVVYGTRLHPKARVIGRSLKREVTSRVFNAILQTYLGAKFSDGMCGFKFLRRRLLPKLRSNGAISDGWFFSTELLHVAQRLGYRLFELPVHWTDDPNSKVNIPRLTWQYLLAMRELRRACP